MAPSLRDPRRNQPTDGLDAKAPEQLTPFTLFNIQGLKPRTVPTKVPFLQDLLQHNKQFFVALTETWLREHLYAELHVDGYTILRQDRLCTKRSRQGRDSGCVALYVREDLAATVEPIINFPNSVVEVLGLHIKAEDLVLIVIYRQPDDPTGGHRSTSAEFCQALRKIESALESLPSRCPDVILCVNINLPHVLWPEGTVKPGATEEERIMAQDLISLVNDHFLFQQIMHPTHRCGNIIDLWFSNNPGLLSSNQCTRTILSDHHIVK